MKILVVGGTGMLSGAVAKLAHENGYAVTALNRGTHPSRMVSGVRLVKADMRSVDAARIALGDETFDVVVDFISFTPAQLSGTFSTLESRCGQYIFVSSATTYSSMARGDIKTEESPIFNHRWSYALHKSQCETLLRKRCTERSVDFTIVRPYITYGRTRIPFGLIAQPKQWTLMHRIAARKPVVLWDDGSAVCTLTHTTDFAAAVVGLFGNSRARNEIFNVTSSDTFTWREVLDLIAEAVGEVPVVANVPSFVIAEAFPDERGRLLGDRARDNIFDNTKIKEAVPGLSFSTDIRIGLRMTMEYYRSHEAMMQVDYTWDGRMDRLVRRCCSELRGLASCRLGYVADADAGARDRLRYVWARSPVHFGVAERICRAVQRVLPC